MASSATAPQAKAHPWPATPAGGVALLIAATLLMRVAFDSTVGLGIDESYMVAAGRTLRLGYFDHPPAAWWLAWMASNLTGSDNGLTVRLPFIVLFALSTWLMFRLACDLFSTHAGFWAATMFNATPLFGVAVGSWVLPDGPLTTALLGAALCLRHALRSDGNTAWRWWISAGSCAGLALLSKYTAALSVTGACAFLLTQASARRWMWQPHPYAAVGVAALLFSPVLIWNATHGWASIAFQSTRVDGGRWHPFGPISAVIGEAAFLLPWIWLPLVILAVKAMRHGPSDPGRWLLTCMAWPPIGLFLAVSLRSTVLFHWAAPGYLMLFPLLGEAIARRHRERVVRTYVAATALLVCVAVTVVATEVRYNWLATVLGDFEPGRDPDLDLVDWTSIRNELAERGLLFPSRFVMATTRWHDAGKLDYALGGQTVLCLGEDPREYGIIADATSFTGRDVLIVAPRTSPEQIRRRLSEWFDQIVPLEPVILRHSGQAAMSLSLFLGRNLHAPR